jgi:O-methyltransferase involved in polyketide biosynthesis
MYLEHASVMATLEYIASVSGSAGGVVFDYALNPSRFPLLRRLAFHAVAARVRAVGEPWRAFFDPVELAEDMKQLGFADVTDSDARTLYRAFVGAGGDSPATASRARLMRGLRRLA